ncbi:MAG: hypothetical protein O7G83_20900 [Proteobacteria bacterium]|nr:hypothetical protein [Pseudomonadota bacterium]
MVEHTIDSNRRERYRLEPSPVLEPILSIIHDGRRVTADTVIDVNLSGARVAFEGSITLNIVPGENVTASVQAPGLDGCADIPARIIFSAIKASRHVVALVFTQTPDLSDRATSDFFSVFNRRADLREAASEPESAASATLVGEARVDLKVLNHSTRGIGFIVDEQTDALLRERQSLALAIQLPQQHDPVAVSVRICHRAALTDTVYYGCMIQSTGGH